MFGAPIAHSRQGLIFSSAAITVMAVFFDLTSIAAIVAISTLAIHMIVHIGHLRLRAKTGASLWLVLAAVGANFAAIVLSAIYLSGQQPSIFNWIGGAFGLALLIELGLRLTTGRVIVKRAPPRMES